MITNTSARQFFKDGLVGIVVSLVIFALSGFFFLQEFRVRNLSSSFEFIMEMFFFPRFQGRTYVSPMLLVLAISFIGSGIGGRYFENFTTRKVWIITAFLSSLIIFPITLLINFGAILAVNLLSGLSDGAGILEIIYVTLYYWPGYWGLGPTLICASIGFLVVSLAGIIFNPNTRTRRILVGAIAITMTGYGFGLMIFAIQGMFS